MPLQSLSPAAACRRPDARRRVRGLTLVEVIISIGILALTSMGGVSGFFLLNRYAANLRNMSLARALCQERIEQAQALLFQPTKGTVPAVASADPSNTAACTILGTAANYSATTGAFTGGTLQTSSETIPVYTQSEGTAANKSPNVTYTRATTVWQAPLANISGASTASLYVVAMTVNVSYTFRGQTYATAMSTLRSPN